MDSGGKSTISKITPSRKWSVADLDENTLMIKRFMNKLQLLREIFLTFIVSSKAYIRFCFFVVFFWFCFFFQVSALNKATKYSYHDIVPVAFNCVACTLKSLNIKLSQKSQLESLFRSKQTEDQAGQASNIS